MFVLRPDRGLDGGKLDMILVLLHLLKEQAAQAQARQIRRHKQGLFQQSDCWEGLIPTHDMYIVVDSYTLCYSGILSSLDISRIVPSHQQLLFGQLFGG